MTGPRPRPLQARFWEHVTRTDFCWVWSTTRNPNIYPQILEGGKGSRQWSAHRLSYTWAYGEIPPGLVIDHLCRNKRCVRPEHLETVRQRNNVLRGDGISAQNAAKAACPCGRDYEVNSRGVRFCRVCRSALHIRGRSRRRAVVRLERAGEPIGLSRRTVCSRGHDLKDEANRYYRPDGKGWNCRPCTLIRAQERNQRLRLQEVGDINSPARAAPARPEVEAAAWPVPRRSHHA
jgi:hypothetical protein